jgi:TRAP-type C4-dicarboxylate transport system permease small subunit
VKTTARSLLANLEEIAAGAALVAIVTLTIYAIVNRYLLLGSAAWAPEVAGMLFAWVVFLGASIAWKRRMHVSIDVLVRRLRPAGQRRARLAVDLVMAAFLAYAGWLALQLTISSHARVSPVMRLPFSIVYASAVVGFALMLLRTLHGLLRRSWRAAER